MIANCACLPLRWNSPDRVAHPAHLAFSASAVNKNKNKLFFFILFFCSRKLYKIYIHIIFKKILNLLIRFI